MTRDRIEEKLEATRKTLERKLDEVTAKMARSFAQVEDRLRLADRIEQLALEVERLKADRC